MDEDKTLKITLTVKTRCIGKWQNQYSCSITGDWYDSLEGLVDHQAFNVLSIDKIEEIKQ